MEIKLVIPEPFILHKNRVRSNLSEISHFSRRKYS